MKHSVLCAAVLFSGWGLLSLPSLQAQSVQPETRRSPIEDGGANAVSRYLLGPDDQITIRAPDVPDINNIPQRLDPNGDLRLPMIGRVHAAGMTLAELEQELIRRLKAYVLEPDVSISLTELRSQPVSILGAVGESGVRQLEGRKTLVEVLSMAGGLSADAGPTVRITRQVDRGRIPLSEATEDASGRFSTVEIDVRSLLEARNPEKNIVIQPHDVISVPRAEIVYVVGEVGKPGPVPLSAGHSISVMEAVSSSGGVLRTAAPARTRLLRRVPGEVKRREMNLNLQHIMHGKADDVPLRAGDILLVPDNSGKRVTARALEAVIQAGLLIGSYGIVR
jgi:polysaccharide biosynthesis/export protein